MPAILAALPWAAIFGSLYAVEKVGDLVNDARGVSLQPSQPQAVGISSVMLIGAGALAVWWIMRGKK